MRLSLDGCGFPLNFLMPSLDTPKTTKRLRLLSALSLVSAACLCGAEPSPQVAPEANGVANVDTSLDPLKQRFVELGDHWSGLDRFELFKEMQAEDYKSASKRLRKAVTGSDREEALLHILLELESTDLFQPVVPQLAQLANIVMTEDGVRKSVKGKSKHQAFLCGLVNERILRDEQSAELAYLSVIGVPDAGDKKVKQLRSGDPDDHSVDRAAAEKLGELQRKKSRRSENKSTKEGL